MHIFLFLRDQCFLDIVYLLVVFCRVKPNLLDTFCALKVGQLGVS